MSASHLKSKQRARQHETGSEAEKPARIKEPETEQMDLLLAGVSRLPGCGGLPREKLFTYMASQFKTKKECVGFMPGLFSFLHMIGEANSKEYFKQIEKRENWQALFDPKVISDPSFILSLGSSAEGYFGALGHTGNVEAFTSVRMKGVADFAREIGPDNAAQFFFLAATLEPERADILFDKRILASGSFIKELNGEQSTSFLQIAAKADTEDSGSLDRLTSPQMFAQLDFIKKLGFDQLGIYFIAAKQSDESLEKFTSEPLMRCGEFIRSLDFERCKAFFTVADTWETLELLCDPRFARPDGFWSKVPEKAFSGYILAAAQNGPGGIANLTDPRLEKAMDFVGRLGEYQSFSYFHIAAASGQFSRLTDDRVLARADIANALTGGITVQRWFSGIAESGEVSLLTDSRLGRAAGFISQLDQDQVNAYFSVLVGVGAVAELTDPRIHGSAGFANMLGEEAAVGYFHAIAETKHPERIAGPLMLPIAEAVKGLRQTVTFGLFRAIAETGEGGALTKPEVLEFAASLPENHGGHYFDSMATGDKIATMTDPRIFRAKEMLSAADGVTAQEYFAILKNTGALDQLTDPRIIGDTEFIRSLGPAGASFLFIVGSDSTRPDLLCDPRLKARAGFVRKLSESEPGDAGAHYLWAITKTGDIEGLTSESTIALSESFGDLETAGAFFHAVGEKGSLGAITETRILANARELSKLGPGVVTDYFMAIANTDSSVWAENPELPSIAGKLGASGAADWLFSIGATRNSATLTDPAFTSRFGFLNGGKHEVTEPFFMAAGKAGEVAEFTDEKLVSYILALQPESAGAYLEELGEYPELPALRKEDFTSWYAESAASGPKTVPTQALSAIMAFSASHGLFEGEHSFSSDLIMKALRPERSGSDASGFARDAGDWAMLAKRIEESEASFGVKFGSEEFTRTLKLVSRTGGSPSFAEFASSVISEKDDYLALVSGSRAMVNAMAVRRLGAYFGGMPGLPDTVKGYGGLETMRLIWENRESFKGNESVLRAGGFGGLIGPGTEEGEAYSAVKSALPRFGSGFSKSYTIDAKAETKPLPPERLSGIAADCESSRLSLFVGLLMNKAETREHFQARVGDSFEALVSSTKGTKVGDEAVRALPGYPYRNGVNSNELQDIARELSGAEKYLRGMEKGSPVRFATAWKAYSQILECAEEDFAFKYYAENFVDNKVAVDAATAQEYLLVLRHYMQDPELQAIASPERKKVFESVSRTVSRDLQVVGEALPMEGVLSVRSWDRGLKDVFGGSSSGDCTSPPKTGEHTGARFEANFGWLRDPGTQILYYNWQPAGAPKPMPVGRAYCFAAELGPSPGVFMDSIEFVLSFNASEGVRRALIQSIQDYSGHLRAPVALNASDERKLPRSNRTWVNDATREAGFEVKMLPARKLGNDVYRENMDSGMIFLIDPAKDGKKGKEGAGKGLPPRLD